MNLHVANQIQDQIASITEEVKKLEKLLEPYEKLINNVSRTPFKSMGISDKIQVAKLITAVREP